MGMENNVPLGDFYNEDNIRISTPATGPWTYHGQPWLIMDANHGQPWFVDGATMV